ATPRHRIASARIFRIYDRDPNSRVEPGVTCGLGAGREIVRLGERRAIVSETDGEELVGGRVPRTSRGQRELVSAGVASRICRGEASRDDRYRTVPHGFLGTGPELDLGARAIQVFDAVAF